ncbi:MAG: hypothetical protein Q7U57_03440 [Methylovulum sp.]|nr:hypothetical protein [Methylovulum sp.]
MKTLQFTIHIENNAQLHLTLPSEYAIQDVELVVIILPTLARHIYSRSFP